MNAERKKNRKEFMDKLRSYQTKQRSVTAYLEMIEIRAEALSRGFVSEAKAVERLMDALEDDFIPEQFGQLSFPDSEGGELVLVDKEG